MKKFIFSFALFFLAACSTVPVNHLYYWGNYDRLVYQYYKQEVPVEQQITELQQIITETNQKNKKVGPGIYAHLGLLYSETGDQVAMKEAFDTEKRLFPDSATLIDYLLSKQSQQKK